MTKNLPASKIREQLRAQAAAAASKVAKPTRSNIGLSRDMVFKMPDGTSSADDLHVVIVDQINQRQWYPGAYSATKKEAPQCFASAEDYDDLAPHPDAPNPQSNSTCADCRWSQYGTDKNGTGQACKDVRALAVIPKGSTNPDHMLTIKPAKSSARNYDTYFLSLGGKDITPVEVTTRIGYDPDLDYPVLVFESTGENEHIEEHFNMRERAQEMLQRSPAPKE